MIKSSRLSSIKVFSALSFLLMVTVNALANILPINGIGTGDVSDSYPNLFAPSGITFAIWGVIYFLLLIYILFLLGLFRQLNERQEKLVQQINPYFIVSSLANTIWIFSWHYQIIPLSLVLMLVILISLLLVSLRFSSAPMPVTDELLLRLPFSVYTGWITVATIANITTLLVSVKWSGWGLSEVVWTIIALIAGLLIGVVTIARRQDIAYGLVLIWAYAGIAIKHLSASEFNSQYPKIIITVYIAIAIYILAIFYVIANRYLKKKKS